MIRNETRGTVVAAKPRFAESLGWRMRGMIGRRFEAFDGLVFDRCGSIHMFFMGMALDIVFLDRHGRVLGLRETLKPWRMAWQSGAKVVVELPVGAIARAGCLTGDQLSFHPPLPLDVLAPGQ